jgi:hypothetical protein
MVFVAFPTQHSSHPSYPTANCCFGNVVSTITKVHYQKEKEKDNAGI